MTTISLDFQNKVQGLNLLCLAGTQNTSLSALQVQNINNQIHIDMSAIDVDQEVLVYLENATAVGDEKLECKVSDAAKQESIIQLGFTPTVDYNYIHWFSLTKIRVNTGGIYRDDVRVSIHGRGFDNLKQKPLSSIEIPAFSNEFLLQELDKVFSSTQTDLRKQADFFIKGFYMGLTKEQRYYFILGGADNLLNAKFITEDLYYDFIALMEKAYKHS